MSNDEILTNETGLPDNGNDEAGATGGANGTAEKPSDELREIIEQLRAQNAHLVEQNQTLTETNNSLQNQIISIVRNGSDSTGGNADEKPMVGSMLWNAEPTTWDDLGRDAAKPF